MPHIAQIWLSPGMAILDNWRTAEGPPSAGPAFLTLLYDYKRFVPPVRDFWPIGGLGWRHKPSRIIESVSFREDPPAGPTQFNLCHFLAWQGPLEVLGSVNKKRNFSRSRICAAYGGLVLGWWTQNISIFFSHLIFYILKQIFMLLLAPHIFLLSLKL